MIKVLKFGGSIIRKIDDLEKVAKIITEEKSKLVIIVSAFYNKTKDLEMIIKKINEKASNQIIDRYLVLGELEVGALLGAYLEKYNCQYEIFDAFQLPILSTSNFGNSEITSVNITKIVNSLNENKIVIIPGFQGKTKDDFWVTLGKESSDLTALHIYKLLKENTKEDVICHLYKDVNGIYSIDPKIKESEFNNIITHDELLKIIDIKKQIVSIKAVKYARSNNLEYSVGKNINNSTKIINGNKKGSIDK